MQLSYKSDWEEAKERYRAWWAHEVLDRCALWVTAPKADAVGEVPPALPARVEDRWLDLDYLAAANDYQMRHTFYGAEAFPVWCPGYPGWATIPCFLDAPITLKEDTGWLEPIIEHGALTDHDYRALQIDPHNRWWRLWQEMLRFSVRTRPGTSLSPP